jgi:hypothetical protein
VILGMSLVVGPWLGLAVGGGENMQCARKEEGRKEREKKE